ncbi:MAG TPA: fasciclin domain-containing protein [Gemmatimonas sp.]|uniref:fasciclin domain-containing protein n=1 Tax=Gemmatimonas sp. TaxID=1962908 RepID=UPI002EDA914C
MRPWSAIVAAAVALAPGAMYAQDKDIVETAAAAGSFKTLTKLLGDAGLTETLRGPGPFTVFAPTDEAFAKLTPGTLEALAKDRSRLRSVLLYHVVAGKITAADAVKLAGSGKKTVEGQEAKISVMGNTPMINNAHVTQTDIAAKNGVIHGIDAVMLPPGR